MRPSPPPILPPRDGFLFLDRDKMPAAFAADVEPRTAALMADAQVPWGLDALGGEMARAIDDTGIQFRRLNTAKGPAVRSTRAQADKRRYRERMRAALEAVDGEVITGCNIENATYGLTMCAERVAMFKALSEGHRAFTRIAIVVDSERPTPPCGACP